MRTLDFVKIVKLRWKIDKDTTSSGQLVSTIGTCFHTPRGMCAYGEHSPFPKRIIEMHLYAPSLIHSAYNSLSQIASRSHSPLVQAETYPDVSLLSCHFVLSSLTSCGPIIWLVSYSVEVLDREFNTEWIREGACK